MGRLTRAETQERTRAKVLAAAREEFAERGFRAAKVDAIAERAELTRGAVYSNFPGKRALYFAVLADDAERAPAPPPATTARTPQEALAAFARAWVTRLPLATDDQDSPTRLGMHLVPEILADDRTRQPYAQLLKLEALVLGLALENVQSRDGSAARLVRVAEAALTVLHGASQLAAAAPGFVEPFDVVRACEHLADLQPGDSWHPPHLPHVAPARPVDHPWAPPPATDLLTGAPARLGDGVVCLLGLHRTAAVEEAVRAAPPGTDVTAVVVTSAPGELSPLVRLVVGEVRSGLRQAFPRTAWPRLQVVCDETASIAAAAGVPAVSDATESAVRIVGGRIVRRADGFGASHAAAAADVPTG
jgi:AcrR family transcriptional regulator